MEEAEKELESSVGEASAGLPRATTHRVALLCRGLRRCLWEIEWTPTDLVTFRFIIMIIHSVHCYGLLCERSG